MHTDPVRLKTKPKEPCSTANRKTLTPNALRALINKGFKPYPGKYVCINPGNSVIKTIVKALNPYTRVIMLQEAAAVGNV